jgi:hypothetical protein
VLYCIHSPASQRTLIQTLFSSRSTFFALLLSNCLFRRKLLQREREHRSARDKVRRVGAVAFQPVTPGRSPTLSVLRRHAQRRHRQSLVCLRREFCFQLLQLPL